MTYRKRYEVYVLLDEDREIRYVGCTTNPDGRRKAHLRDPQKRNLIYETWEVYGNRAREALNGERELIQTLTRLGHNLLNSQHTKSVDVEELRRWIKVENMMEDQREMLDEIEKILEDGIDNGRELESDEGERLLTLFRELGIDIERFSRF